jgi:hypothetical protein
MPPDEIDSLNAESLKGLVLSLLGKIDDLHEHNKALLARIDELLARISELEGRASRRRRRQTRRCRHRASRRPMSPEDQARRAAKGAPA